jgi:hypothetical protein
MTDSAPATRHRIGLAWVSLLDLPAHSRGPRSGDLRPLADAVREAGFDTVQCHDPAQAAAAHGAGLATVGIARCLDAAAVDTAAAQARDAGHEALTLHLGHGFESEAQADRLLDAVACAAQRSALPLFVETHRATLTQDPWRTLGLLQRHPALRLTGDFSHWVAGCELRYGPLDDKIALMAPLFERTAMLHGRIGSAGSFQVCSHEGHHADEQALFERLWRPCLDGAAARGEALLFCVELLPASLHYAPAQRGPDGRLVEDGDRWLEALHLQSLARRLFAGAASSQPEALPGRTP